MAKKRAIELFRTGEHTDSTGNKHTFTADHVQAIAAGFDAKAGPAPVVVGHPAMDAPAYGWTEGLTFNAATGRLSASLDLIDEMDNAIAAKHYNRVSAAFFAPDHPANPKPGQFYLRHVGLLGGAAPAVTALQPFGFADKDKSGGVLEVEFGLGGDRSIGDQLLDALKSYFGSTPPAPGTTFNFNPAYTAPAGATGASTMNEQEKAEFDRIKARNAELETQIKDGAKARFTADANAYVEGLVAAKKVNPAEKPQLVALYMANANTPDVEFSSADGVVTKQSPLVAFKAMLDARAPVISTTETAASDGTQKGAPKPVQFNAPTGTNADADASLLHNKVVAYMAKNGIKEYATALQLVQAG